MKAGGRVGVNVGALGISNLWRVGTSFILQLWIAYQLGLAVLGQYTIVLAYLHVSQILSELGLPTYLVSRLSNAPDQHQSYKRTALYLQLIASFVVWSGLILLTKFFPFSTGVSQSLVYIGASLPLYAITSVYQTLFRASEQMVWIMVVEVAINTLILGLSSWVVWQGGTLVQLVMILVGTQAVSALCCWRLWRNFNRTRMNADERGWEENSALVRSPPRPINRDLLIELWPFYGLALADVLLGRLDILLLSLVAGDSVIGIYSAAYNIVRVPTKLIQSYWQALYPTLSRLVRADYSAYLRLVKQSMGYGLLLVLAGVGLINLLATPLLNLLYQEGVADILPIFRILTLSIPILLIEIGCFTLGMATGRAKMALSVMGLHLCCIALFVPLLINFYGGLGAAYGVLLGSVVGGFVAVAVVKNI